MKSEGLKAHGDGARHLPPERASGARASLSACLLLALCVIGATGFSALGVWQLERRLWKIALIEAVDSRVKAAPAPAPGPSQWRELTPERDGYRKVAVSGRYVRGAYVLVEAVSELGPGYWVVEAFRTDAGFTVLVNRGFISSGAEALFSDANSPSRAGREEDKHAAPSPPRGPLHITGLLRMSEPGGGFLRRNDPRGHRWYSRDVIAIAQALSLGVVAPYFIDADGAAETPGGPVGGLTVIRFSNSHLVYALTWFSLAALCILAGARVIKDLLEAGGAIGNGEEA